MASNFKCTVETEGLLRVTGIHILCKGGNVSEMVKDGDVVTAGH